MAFWKEYLDATNGTFQLQRLENFQHKMLFLMGTWEILLPGRRGYFFGVARSLKYITAVR